MGHLHGARRIHQRMHEMRLGIVLDLLTDEGVISKTHTYITLHTHVTPIHHLIAQ